MNALKSVMRYFDQLAHEIRLLNLKKCCIFSCIFLVLGIFSWIVGGRVDKVTVFYIYPRCAIPILYAFLLWGVSFCFCGFVLGGVVFGCEKYKRQKTYKIGFFICIMQMFTLCVYPLFFGALAPLVAFAILLISMMFCFLAIMASFKIYCLWTICLSIQFLWLLYNAYVSLAFAFVN